MVTPDGKQPPFKPFSGTVVGGEIKLDKPEPVCDNSDMALITDPDEIQWDYLDKEADMAVKKAPMGIAQAVGVFGVEGHVSVKAVSYLDSKNFQAVPNLSGTKIEIFIEGELQDQSIQMKAGALKLLEEGMMPEAGKELAQIQLVDAIKNILATVDVDADAVWSEITEEDVTKVMGEQASESDFLVEVEKEDFVEFTEGPTETEKMTDSIEEHIFGHPNALKMDQVKLVYAKAVYQPVNGTSETSTYHCIAKAGELKFAARFKDDSLSIRVEGPVFEWSSKLIAAGFNESYIEKGYTSVHFSGLSDLMAKRTMGAVLAGTGLDFETPMPDLDKIKGEGK